MAPKKSKWKTEERRQTRVDNNWWEIKAIIGEKQVGNQPHYLVDWEGLNPETKRPWPTQWLSRDNVTKAAIAEWEKTKTAVAGATANPGVTAKRGRGRLRKENTVLKDAVPAAPPSVSSVSSSSSAGRAGRSEHALLRSSTRNTSISSAQGPSSHVAIDPRNPSSLEGYQYISQLDESQWQSQWQSQDPAPAHSQSAKSPTSSVLCHAFSSSDNSVHSLTESVSRAESSFWSTGVVQESEDEEDEFENNWSATYVPTSQTTGSASHITPSQPFLSHPLTNEDTSNSTSLDQSPPSPLLSIPETEPEVVLTAPTPAEEETIEESIVEDESGAQLPEESQQEVPDTFETDKSTQEELTDVPQSTVQELLIEDVQRSMQEEFADAPQSTAQDSYTQGVEAAQRQPQPELQSAAEESLVLDIQSTTQEQHDTVPVTASLCPADHQGKEAESEELTTILDSVVDTSSLAEEEPESRPSQEHSAVQSDQQSTTLSTELRDSQDPSRPHSVTPISQEQHAQVVSNNSLPSTQQEYLKDVGIDSGQSQVLTRPNSRHDSSQDSPDPPGTFVDNSSPVPRPPKQSLGTLESTHAPPRLRIPTSSSSAPDMSENGGKKPTWAEGLMAKFAAEAAAKAAIKKKERELERKRKRESRELESRAPSESLQGAARNHLEEQAAQSAHDMKQQSALPMSNVLPQDQPYEESVPPTSEIGTRSPSTIPNRDSLSHISTPLRTAAIPLPNSIPSAMQNQIQGNSGGSTSTPSGVDVGAPWGNTANGTEVERTSPVLEDIDMIEAPYDEDEDEDESLLNDDLHLQLQEFIVPLPIQGRQADQYRLESRVLSDLLVNLTRGVSNARRKVEEVFYKLRSIETHVDLISPENSTAQPNDTQQNLDRTFFTWTHDNCIKFRFLSALLARLQGRDLHVVLVIEKEDNARVFKFVESFLRGLNVSFDSPITGQSHNATDDAAHREAQLEDANKPNKDKKLLRITILSSTSTRLTREVHLAVCLDGKPDAAEIREKPWALKLDRSVVPILHLVIPRTIGHIDHYLSPRINITRRQHTIIATLSQFSNRGVIGQAVNYTPTKSYEVGFADEVVKFLLPSDEEPTLSEWPLPAIGSIKDIIEYQSQQSVEALEQAAPLPGAIAAGKRALIADSDREDPAKRMRFSSQPHTQAPIPRGGDFSPPTGSSTEHQRDYWKEDAIYHRTVLQGWVGQQARYEERRAKMQVLEDEKEAADKKYATSEERCAKLREQLNTRTADCVELHKRLEEQQSLNSLSEDEKILKIAEKDVQISNLNEELAKQKKATQDALEDKKRAEMLRDYAQNRFQEMESDHRNMSTEVEQLRAENAKMKRAENARPLAQQHYQMQEQLAAKQEERAGVENNILKKQLQVKVTENEKLKAELERLKSSRGLGGATRAASAGPRTPRPGSRAASPLPNGRDRVANLRNG
ncbi:hypothetical protein BU23DRAFT_559395 [Bimuria novae-zelandiae CBS 107.79]|uniref:Chromo domain-containing protein n=1 Tax=Bimuria novae-zelandiae CBS 107.79 TaxID=1447943 RepID=A0A6A5US53_9PLEO|nr:hypothetical protein BU23DRAFT_559395 [Bimuria novae-zelandiae CBS 107.79]